MPRNDVLPFYRNLDLPVKAVRTDNVPCGRGIWKRGRGVPPHGTCSLRCRGVIQAASAVEGEVSTMAA